MGACTACEAEDVKKGADGTMSKNNQFFYYSDPDRINAF